MERKWVPVGGAALGIPVAEAREGRVTREVGSVLRWSISYSTLAQKVCQPDVEIANKSKNQILSSLQALGDHL